MEAKFFNDNFYPTPPELGEKMIGKVKGWPKRILEPSAGRGDLIKHLNEFKRRSWGRDHGVMAIEIDEDLQSILRGKGIPVLDSDFLNFSGPDKFDLIIMNPPFETDCLHLLKAIDIMYRGQVVCLMNAETLKNPYSKTRKFLADKLEKLGADIEYIEGAFVDSERPTGVEVALVSIVIERRVEDDLFSSCSDVAQDCNEKVKDKFEVSTGKNVRELVLEYNQVLNVCTETIITYFKNHNKIYKYLGLNREPEKASYGSDTLTEKMQDTVNRTVRNIRTDFWRRTLNLEEVKKRLTSAKKDEFESQLSKRCSMDFTENNIRSFILSIINGYEKTIMDSVLALFDRFTIESCYRDTLYEKNIHYFNGWKTNDAFRVGKKVIIPIRAGYEGPFRSWGKWSLDYQAAYVLRDIDLVMNYFDGLSSYFSMADAIEKAFAEGQSSGIDSTYFTATCHKKGTIHLKFKNEDILRRFNVAACKGKGWLPEDYGEKAFKTLSLEAQSVADSFEGRKSYEKNVGQGVFGNGCNTLQLLAA